MNDPMEDRPASRPRWNRGIAVTRPVASCRQAGCIFGREPGGALLEVCVHTSANDIPPDFTVLKIGAPEVQIQAIRFDELPAEWQSRLEFTRDLGTAWLQKKETPLLRVPSAIVPETANFLLNPTHPDAKKFKVIEASPYPFDFRLKK